MGAVARSRAFHCDRDTEIPTGVGEGRHIIEPGFLVKVSREKPAGFVLEQGIDANGVSALQMVEDNLIADRQKCLVLALTALHPGFFADATYPFIAAGRRISFPAGLRTHPEQWKDIVPATE